MSNELAAGRKLPRNGSVAPSTRATTSRNGRVTVAGDLARARRGGRAVCSVCLANYRPKRADSRYCSAACRQRAFRARADSEQALLQQIDETRVHYWQLVAKLALTLRMSTVWIRSNYLSQWVDEDGYIYMRDRLIGRATPTRAGWAGWGLEAAGPPWCPPTAHYTPTEAERKRARMARDSAEKATP